MATIVGTATNLVFVKIYHDVSGVDFAFVQWLLIGLPVSLSLVAVIAFWLNYVFLSKVGIEDIDVKYIRNELNSLGKTKKEEIYVSIVFVSMALLWMTRKTIAFKAITFFGWSEIFLHSKFIDDGTVAVLCALILFMTPSSDKKGTLLDASDLKAIPWETVLLFGGGFAIAGSFESTGLTDTIAHSLANFMNLNYMTAIGFLAGSMSFITELTSNMSSTELVLPILIPLAKSMGVEPIILMIPVTLAASCAFMLPAATAPNSIVIATGKIDLVTMAKVGFLLNIISVFVICFLSYFLIPLVLG